MLCQFNW